MKCPTCRKAELTTSIRNHRYSESGLDNVVLHGITISHCPNCGEELVSIRRIDELHEAIAFGLIRKPGRLTSSEIRFLRKWLGLSGVDFARMMGVDPTTVSRWESLENPKPMAGTAERLLRMAVAHVRPVEKYPIETLQQVDAPPAKRPLVTLRPTKGGWIATSV